RFCILSVNCCRRDPTVPERTEADWRFSEDFCCGRLGQCRADIALSTQRSSDGARERCQASKELWARSPVRADPLANMALYTEGVNVSLILENSELSRPLLWSMARLRLREVDTGKRRRTGPGAPG